MEQKSFTKSLFLDTFTYRTYLNKFSTICTEFNTAQNSTQSRIFTTKNFKLIDNLNSSLYLFKFKSSLLVNTHILYTYKIKEKKKRNSTHSNKSNAKIDYTISVTGIKVDFECSCFPYSSFFIGGNGIEILHVEKFTAQVIKILQARNGRINRPVVTCNPLSSFAREHRAGIAAYAA